MAGTSNVGVVVVSMRGVPGVASVISAVELSIGLNVGVGVKVRVGSGIGVAVLVGGINVGGTGVVKGTSGVGVAYSPHSEGVCTHEVSKKAAMQNANTKRLTSHPSKSLYPGGRADMLLRAWSFTWGFMA